MSVLTADDPHTLAPVAQAVLDAFDVAAAANAALAAAAATYAAEVQGRWAALGSVRVHHEVGTVAIGTDGQSAEIIWPWSWGRRTSLSDAVVCEAAVGVLGGAARSRVYRLAQMGPYNEPLPSEQIAAALAQEATAP